MGAYGAVGMKYNEELLSIEEKAGSFYFFIPQVIITCAFPWVQNSYYLCVRYAFHVEVI